MDNMYDITTDNYDLEMPDPIGTSLLEFPANYIVLDLETTGLNPIHDEIIEVGYIKYQNFKEVESFEQLVKPNVPISPFISNLTGITNDMVEDCPYFEEFADMFYELLGDSVIVGHNIPFDIEFLRQNFYKYYRLNFANDYIDTLQIAKLLYPQMKSYKLTNLFKEFCVPDESYEDHRSLGDCYKTNSLFKKFHADYISNGNTFNPLDYTPKMNSSIKRTKYKYFENTRSPTQKELAQTACDEKIFDPLNPLYQKNVVITGSLSKYSRFEAAKIICQIGGIFHSSVTKNTNFLIVGNLENSGVKQSAKQKRAEEMKNSGKNIQIIDEQTFYSMIGQYISHMRR